ncbi:MAG: hypothetical protein AAF546_03190 [Verrucomicrobiota bacterium]
MKRVLTTILVCTCISAFAQEISKKADFIKENEKGELVVRGVYTTDDSGYVIRYDLFDGKGNLIQTSIPYYSRNGRLLESREYDSEGNLLMVAVFIGNRIVALDPEGKRVEKYDNQEVDMEGFLEHFRNGKGQIKTQ